jgi:dephospho-CoA kinase
MKQKKTKIIAVVGMSGSGKSTAVDYLKQKGVPQIYFGGVILGEMRKLGIEITEANEKAFREKIREQEGKDFVVRRAIREIEGLIAAGQHKILLDGLYSWTEYKILKQAFPTEITIIALVPDKKLRQERVGARQERPLTIEEINKRDYAEIENLEKGGPIAMADFFLINNGETAVTQKRLDEILTQTGFLPI